MAKRQNKERVAPARSAGAHRPSGARSKAVGGRWQAVPLWILLGLLVVGPEFRGLFFPGDQLWATALLVALAVWRWTARAAGGRGSWLEHPLDYAVLAVWGAYLVSTAVAANYRDAVQAVVFYGACFLTYWLAAGYAGEGAGARRVLEAFSLAAVGVAVVGVGAAAGTIPYNGAFVDGRIYASFQYPNTTASYLGAAFFAQLALSGPEFGPADRWRRPLLAAAAGFTFLVFAFTLSRGGWLVFPASALLFWLLAPRSRRAEAGLAMALPVAAALVAARPFALGIAQHRPAWIWGAALLAAALAAGLSAAARWAGRRWSVWAPLGGGAALAAVAAAVLGRRAHDLPGQLVERLRSIRASDYDAWSRIQWTRDALRIARDHPLLGTGGGGWNAVYHMYQSYGYFSTQVHDHFAQVLVETGVVGLGAYLVAWALFLATAWRAIRSAAGATRSLAVGATVAAVTLGIHSAIDFNLSLLAVSLALYALFGVVRGLGPQPRAKARRVSAVPFGRWAAVYLGGTAAVVLCLSLWGGYLYGQRALTAARAGRAAEAERDYRQAISLDPLSASFRGDLGQMYAGDAAQSRNAALDGEARALLRSAVALDRFNADVHTVYGNYLMSRGDVQGGLAELERALDLAPFEAPRYEVLADAYARAAQSAFLAGQKEAARQDLQRVDQVAARLAEQSRRVPEQAVPVYPTPASTPVLELDRGQALVLTGRWQEALAALAPLEKDGRVGGMAALWAGVARERAGDGAAAQADLQVAQKALGPRFNQDQALVRAVVDKAVG